MVSQKTIQKENLHGESIIMPKTGFKSITVTETVYDKFFDEYLKKKDELSMKGITSFSGFVTCELAQILEIKEVNER